MDDFRDFLVSGWLVAFAGVFTGYLSIVSGSLIALLPGFGICVSGLFLVTAGQITRATVDNADHTREILKLIKEKS